MAINDPIKGMYSQAFQAEESEVFASRSEIAAAEAAESASEAEASANSAATSASQAAQRNTELNASNGYALNNIAATYNVDRSKLSLYPTTGNVVIGNYYLYVRNGLAEVWRADSTIRVSDPRNGNFTLLPRSDQGGVLLTSQLAWLSMDISAGSVFKFTLTDPITQAEFVNIPTEVGRTVEVTLILKQGVGSQKVNWPSNIKWQNGREPVLSYKLDAEDIIVFTFVNGNTTPYAYFVSGWQL